MACRLPGGAGHPEAFWRLLQERRDAVVDVPADRWDHAACFHPHPDAPGRTVARQAAFLEAVYDFDAGFFGISPREAEAMDPQQRLLLELACEAVEEAGCPLESLAGSPTGVFIGLSSYDVALHADSFGWATHAATGASPALCSSRISYCLDLRGPSLTIDTACSASLSALDAACRSLAGGQCRQALVGAVNLLLDPAFFLAFSRLHMLGPGNRCRPFDAAADGFVRGEGGVMFLLKPLTTARSDGDRILARVLATALNQDGRSPGITVPNSAAQAALLREVYASQPRLRERVAYVETHGTGTPVGDPIEARALGQVLGRPERPLWIGSAKSNLGHLEGAAGAVGLLKALLCLRHGRVPASLHFHQPALNLEELGLAVVTSDQELPSEAVIGVNSFGFGGANAHAVLAAGSPAPDTPAPPLAHYLLPVSAACPAALEARVRQWAASLNPADLSDRLYWAARRTSQHAYRAAFVGSGAEELAAEMRLWRPPAEPVATQPPGAVFVFCGQGSQWCGMGRQLLEEQPVFRDLLQRCARHLNALGGFDLLAVLGEAESLDDTLYAQPTIFAVQAGLLELWRHWGVEPAAVVGHSVGEVAAAYAAGVLSLEQAIEVIYARARHMRNASIEGGMLTLECEEPIARQLLAEANGALEIGAWNGPASLALSGPRQELDSFCHRAGERGFSCRPLPVQYAFHSALVEPVREPLVRDLRALQPGPARRVMYSTVTAQPVAGPELNADYWWRNVRSPVLFGPVIEKMVCLGYRLFLEVGPHPVLARHLPDAVASLRRGQPETPALLRALGRLWGLGLPVRWQALYPQGNRVDLPPYPWQRRTYRSRARDRQRRLFAPQPFALLGQQCDHSQKSWLGVADSRLHPFLADHLLEGSPVLSASALLELGLEAASAAGLQPPLRLLDVRLEQACLLQPDLPTPLQTTLDPVQNTFTIASLTGQERWSFHVHGRCQAGGPWAHPPAIPWERLSPAELRGPERWRFGYGPAYQTVGRVWRGPDMLVCEVEWPEEGDFLVHPGGLDAGIRAILALVRPPVVGPARVAFPAGCEEVLWQGRPRGTTWVYSRLLEERPREWLSEVVVCAEAQLWVRLKGLRWKVVPENAVGCPGDDLLLDLSWQPWAAPPASAQAPPAALRGPGAWRLPAPPAASALTLYAADAGDPLVQMEELLGLLRQCQSGRLALLTFQAQSPAPELSLSQAALLGFWRALQREHPRLCPLMVDLPEQPEAADLACLERALSGSEQELVVRNGVLWAPRWRPTGLARLAREAAVDPEGVWGAEVEPWTQGLEGLAWRQRLSLDGPGAGQVWLRVEAAGLNFSDVMKVLGVYPGGPQPEALGLECAGVVVAVGPNVAWPRLGDRVVALGAGLLANRVCVEAALTAPWPAELTAAQAAALPLASVTASLALEELAGLKAGERVLIHCATGGVGLAAVALARRLGAEVLASAGSPKKRQLLADMGIQQVLDSRLPSFVELLPEGVDVVLNCLAEPRLERELQCLRPLGRWVEIGKRDIYANRALPLGDFRRGVRFLPLDVQVWAGQDPARVGACLGRAMAAAEPLPTRTWSVDELPEALRLMAAAGHLGKQVLALGAPPSDLQAPSGLAPEYSGTCLISGGLSGLGAALARWLARTGVRHLLLLGRRGSASPEAPALLAELQRLGVEVVVQAADLAELEPEDFRLNDLPPLEAIFHAANHMEDALAMQLTAGQLQRVYRSKAEGAERLDRLSRVHPVRHFVLFSSISGAFGAAGQANYCAANAYLEALAQQRRQQGLPALVVSWGPVRDAGYLTRHPRVMAQLEGLGHEALDVETCLALLGRLLVLQPVQVAVARADWPRLPPCSLLSDLQRRSPAPVAPREPVLPFLAQQAERILRLPGLEQQLHRPLRELGLDSLLAVEFRNAIERHYGITLPVGMVLSGPSLVELGRLVEAAAPAPEVDLPHLSDEEVGQLLAQLEESPGSDRGDIPESAG